MKDLQKSLPHLITALAVMVACVILAIDHLISGGEAFGGILVSGGFTMGGTVAAGSISTAATAAADVSQSALSTAKTPSPPPVTLSPPVETNPPTNPGN